MTNTERALREAKMGTETIIQIIEAVDHRAMAADGPVTPTRLEMSDDEMRDIYQAAQLADAKLSNLLRRARRRKQS